MQSELKQKRWDIDKHFTLKKDSIIVEEKFAKKITTKEIPFSSLGIIIHLETEDPKKRKRSLIAFVLIIVLSFIFSLLGWDSREQKSSLFSTGMLGVVGLAVVIFRPKEDYVYLKGGTEELKLYLDRPSKPVVMAFVEQVRVEVKDHIRRKYSVFNRSTTKEVFYKNISWLLRYDFITAEEFEEMKEDFDIKYNDSEFWRYSPN